VNTEGHADVAHSAGIPLLKKAFGEKNRSLDALELGNWLTDVSQAVDPVAFATVAEGIRSGGEAVVDDVRKGIDTFVEQFLATVFERLGTGGQALRSLKPDLAPYAKAAKGALNSAIDDLLVGATDERGARVARFCRDAFLVKGYFKFVHPDVPGQPRMDFAAFITVFGRSTDTRGGLNAGPANDRPGAYTQYYPHEHLDRPELLPSQKPKVFAPGPQAPGVPNRVAFGSPRAGTRSPRDSQRLEPDLYSYLRDDIQMTAGLLSEVDLAMREALASSRSDTDPGWHVTLAKLGHALHQVEDFFAHSNWCELAHTRLGSTYLQKAIPPSLPVEMLNRAETIYLKRLRRHLTTQLPNWRDHETERWVVTGYFDFRDTAVSLAHLAEEVFGFDVADPWAEGWDLYQSAKSVVDDPRAAEFQVAQTMRRTLDTLTNPERALNDPDNSVAKAIEKKFGKDVKRLRRPGVSEEVAREVLQETTFLKSAPPEIQQAFLAVIVEGSRVVAVHSLYGALKEVAKFFGNPVSWLLEWLPDKLREKLVGAIKFYGRERFYDAVAADRIGCHSLLAKDHGREPFFNPAKECATAVHWWIVKTLLRWKENPDSGYVDWLELLEHFLRNPLSPDKVRKERGWLEATIVHTVRHKEQLKAKDPRDSLEAIYKPTAVRPDVFTWRSIADANFNTAGKPLREAQDGINQILRDNAWGVPVTPPNYAFKAGLRILIPSQRVRVEFLVPDSDERPWFQEVFDKGWKVFRGVEDPSTQESKPGITPHTPKEISRRELDAIVSRGREFRTNAREAYRPPAAASVP
jgi:hypothetical protein